MMLCWFDFSISSFHSPRRIYAIIASDILQEVHRHIPDILHIYRNAFISISTVLPIKRQSFHAPHGPRNWERERPPTSLPNRWYQRQDIIKNSLKFSDAVASLCPVPAFFYNVMNDAFLSPLSRDDNKKQKTAFLWDFPCFFSPLPTTQDGQAPPRAPASCAPGIPARASPRRSARKR
jgi:hypothetical protein